MSDKQLHQAVMDYLRAVSKSETAAVRAEHLFGTGAIGELECKIAKFYGMKHALCVSNATTGLFVIALALGLKKSEFITTPYTYGGSLASWLMLENKAVFADIEAQTLTLSPENGRQSISPKTKAILSVDILGNPADIFALRKIADENGLWLIADAAQSFGAKRKGFPASHLADALVVSFTSGKPLFAGEGGAIVTDNSNLYEKLLFYSQHPFRQKRELGLDISNEFGFNGRIHPLAAIWANTQFARALNKLMFYQKECLKILDCLNQSGLIEEVNFRNETILPSFFRLTVAPRKRIYQQRIVDYLVSQGFHIKPTSVPVSVIYQNEAFLAQYKKQFSLPQICPVAEQQAVQRIGLVLQKNTGGKNK